MDRNEMKIEFGSDPRNESFARVVVASFMTRTNPTLEEVADVVYISFGKPELKLCVKSMGTDV